MIGGIVEEERNETDSRSLEGTAISIPISLLSSNPASPPSNSRAVPTTSSIDTPWSTSISVLPIEEFASEVGPTVNIPDSLLKIFELFLYSSVFRANCS